MLSWLKKFLTKIFRTQKFKQKISSEKDSFSFYPEYPFSFFESDPLNPKKSFFEQYSKSAYFSKTENDLADVIQNRGSLGELQACSELEKAFPSKCIFPNVYVEWDVGKTSEIDVILLLPCGLFVLEYKNYSGSVYGKDDFQNWLYYLGKQKYEFYNPILQNKGHLNAIKSLFPYISEQYIIPIVVFSNRCELHIQTEHLVTQRQNLIGLIDDISSSLPIVFSSNEMCTISNTLLMHLLPSDYVKKNHIDYVKTKNK